MNIEKTCVKYVLNTYINYLYIISLYSFLIALYIKDVKPISSASVVQNQNPSICHNVSISKWGKRGNVRAFRLS